jgi:DNA-binding transcriptional LysR family regulator
MFNKLDYLRIFCVAAETQTFKEAAVRLGISPQSVTRAIQELEAELGEMLFARSTRSIKITTFGEHFVAQAKSAIASVDKVFSSPHGEVDKNVKMTAPYILGERFIMPLLSKIHHQHADIAFDLRLSNTISNVVDEQIDIGLRVGSEIKDNRFIARSLASIHHPVVATPALLAKIGEPLHPQDLHHLPVSSVINRNTNQPWSWMFNNGKFQPEKPLFTTDEPEMEIHAILAGICFGQVASFVALPYLRSGELVEVLTPYRPTPWELFVYRPQRGPVSPRVRIVFDQFVTAFADPAFFPR